MRRCVILQPSYFPWLGVFQLVARANVYIHLDTVNFDQNGWRNRNRLRFGDTVRWLTVPVSLPRGRLRTQLPEVQIADTEWYLKHLARIRQSLGAARYFSDVEEFIFPLLVPANRLLDVTIPALEVVARLAGTTAEFRLASHFESVGGKTSRLISLCQQVGATHYLSGPSARDYLDESEFERAGIAVEWMQYGTHMYPQIGGHDFVPRLSVLDALANVGADGVANLIFAS